MEDLPEIEAGLSHYMRAYGLERIGVNGHYLELTDGGLEVREALQENLQQLELELGSRVGI